MRCSLLILLLCSACGTSVTVPVDGGGPPADAAAPQNDAGRLDAGGDPRDSGPRADAGDVDAGDVDAGDVDAGDVDAGDGTGPPPRGPGVRCDGVTCGSEAPVCFACRHRVPAGTADAHCEPATIELNGFFDHECDFPAVFAGCDGPEDCGVGERCSFGGGEWGTTTCEPVPAGGGAAGFGWACHDDTDCDPGVRCEQGDRLGYFAELAGVTGWTPYVCGGAL